MFYCRLTNTHTHMKLTNEQHEQLLDAIELLKSADAEDINTVIDAHDGEDERIETLRTLRATLEWACSRVDDDLETEIEHYEGEALDTVAYDADTLEKYRRFALHSRATQYFAMSHLEQEPLTLERKEILVEQAINDVGGLTSEGAYKAAVDALTEVMLDT